MKSQLPQQPKGTNEKNEKKELNAAPNPFPVLDERRKAFFLLILISHLLLSMTFLLYDITNPWIPVPIANPIIIGEFTWITADIDALGGKLGEVNITINK